VIYDLIKGKCLSLRNR